MMFKSMLFVVIAMMVVFSSGCGPSVPTGFPSLKPFQVTVTNGGSPIEGVTVQFASKSESVFITGTTNSSGVAAMETSKGSYSRTGVPVGEYSVVLSQSVHVDMPPLSEEASMALTQSQQEARDQEFKKKVEAAQVIPADLEDANKTPVTANVGEGETKLEIDIAKYKK